MRRLVALWRQESYAFNDEVGRPLIQRLVDLVMQECYTYDDRVGRPLEQRSVNLTMRGVVNPTLQGLLIYCLNDIYFLIGTFLLTLFIIYISMPHILGGRV